jgi:hypothetical protein
VAMKITSRGHRTRPAHNSCPQDPVAVLASMQRPSSDEYRGGSGESDQVCKWCSVVTTGTKPTPTKEQPITNRHTDHIRTRQNLLYVELSL